ncbi:MAG TPA: response regulator [Coleofasciculaceae cyanobacterium]
MNRILITEDEPRIASLLEKGLQTKGFATAIASDGYEALELVQHEDFALLLLDLGLPGKDGLTVLRELRNQDERLPVIILSARNDVKEKVTGLSSGANDYMTKPFRFQELLARIQAQLRHQGE